MYLMQGRPGSGKSTFVRTLLTEWLSGEALCNTVVVSADHWFMKNGEYIFDPAELPNAHRFCQGACWELISEGRNVVVDNCNLLQEHAQPYIDMAKDHGYTIVIFAMTKYYGNDKGLSDDYCLNKPRHILLV